MMLKTVRQLLQNCDCQVRSIGPDASVLDALRQMEEHDIASLLVVEGDRLVGVVSEADYARKVALRRRGASTTAVRDIMSTELYTIDPGQSLEDSIELMTRRNLNLLPVVDGLRVIGMVSLNDAVRATLNEQRSTIRFLEELVVDF